MANDDGRPDPDALLARIHDRAGPAARGRLRIYLGAAAGVGTTSAMLAAARLLAAVGVDVVAGVIETHGRAETAGQVGHLERLPLADVPHRGTALQEFDLDGALARRPALLLVDELAHSNAAGSRHAKRWQDVDELLAAGVGVYATLNVQHLESLNDVVGGITGIRVRETLPDTFFDGADEVVLVDTPADELIARLRAGKVYPPAQADQAARNFFRKGNLMALRELALRRTANRVEGEVQAYRVDRSIGQVWKTEAGLLCCIGARESADHVVRSAARLAQQLAVGWHAVVVETPALRRLGGAPRERLLRAVKLAQGLGATTAVLPGRRVAPELVRYARRHNLSRLLLGHARERAWRIGPALGRTLTRLAPDVDLIEAGGGRSAPAPTGRPPRFEEGADEPAGPRFAPYLWSIGACASTTLLARPLQPYFALANTAMLLLLTVVGVAVRLGRGPAALAAFLNVAAFDYFFVPPTLSFSISDIQYLFTFAVMLGVGLIVGQLTAGLRFEASVATHRERRSRALFEFARALTSVLMREQVIEVAEKTVALEFRAEARVLALDAQERLEPPAPGADGIDLGAAQWAMGRDEAAGLGTDTLAGSRWLYLPLRTPMRARGVLAVRPEEARLLLMPEQRRQLETFAALLAVALERVHYVDVAQSATVQMESERLRHSLLAAVSHDLRTPLASIYGASELLVRQTPGLPAAAAELAHGIAAGARRMAAMVANLLDMARLQSGPVQLHLQWQPLDEILGSALQATAAAMAAHRVVADLAPDLPLLNVDAILVERVFCNLLENAAKYTPPGGAVTISARRCGDDVVTTVADDGPGLPPGREEALFEKFARGERESATPGVGLGLAICRAIVEAHGGRIRVDAGDGPAGRPGARFRFTLPIGSSPEPPAPEDGGAP
ncbi:MAG: DUF4118 domain-containing protein [Burkholderiaceae bacterium]